MIKRLALVVFYALVMTGCYTKKVEKVQQVPDRTTVIHEHEPVVKEHTTVIEP
jgi:hypothetical protein